MIAKRLDLPYQSGERTGMQKLKQMRTADCVVGGFRYASKGKVVGSLLLGLYDEDGLLTTSASAPRISAKRARGAHAEARGARRGSPASPGRRRAGRAAGAPSARASGSRSRPKLVVEVEYDHFTGGRFRHGTGFLRWRPDKAPRQCTMKQVEREAASSLLLLGAATRSATRKTAASQREGEREAEHVHKENIAGRSVCLLPSAMLSRPRGSYETSVRVGGAVRRDCGMRHLDAAGSADGAEYASQLNSQLPVVNDPAVEQYINQLGDSIAKLTGRGDLDWHFFVVNTDVVNAFALPGGFIT